MFLQDIDLYLECQIVVLFKNYVVQYGYVKYKNCRNSVLFKDCFKSLIIFSLSFYFLCVNVIFRNIGIIVDELFVL